MLPLVPIGDWKFEFVMKVIVNDTDELVLTFTNFYEIKPTGAEQF